MKTHDIEIEMQKINWKEFEKSVADIFHQNEFILKKNFRFKTKRRSEIDLIASRYGIIFCIDCKQWGKGRYKISGLKKAVKDQENRVKELGKFLKTNPIARSMLKLNLNSQKFYPLIVTLCEEEIVKEHNTYIIPVWKLNSFLLEVENFL